MMKSETVASVFTMANHWTLLITAAIAYEIARMRSVIKNNAIQNTRKKTQLLILSIAFEDNLQSSSKLSHLHSRFYFLAHSVRLHKLSTACLSWQVQGKLRFFVANMDCCTAKITFLPSGTFFEIIVPQVICEPLVLTLAYVGMVGPLSTPDILYPGPRGDKVSTKYSFIVLSTKYQLSLTILRRTKKPFHIVYLV